MRLLQAFVCIVMLSQGSVSAQDNTGTSGAMYAESDGAPASDSGVSVTVDDSLVILPRDIVLVLDNSGSMKITDPDFQITAAISDFISQLGDETNLAIIVFDQQIRLAVSLTPASGDNQQRILSGLEQLNYNGLFRDTPTAIERAVYELRNNGREEAAKHIVFITDGVSQTDNNATQLERSEWLVNELAETAVANNIRISGIGFTENADMNLIQALADKTGGEAYQLL
ncbi:MAG: vWA domain-containing protein, partial [Gammaproteobacteria bacterium]